MTIAGFVGMAGATPLSAEAVQDKKLSAGAHEFEAMLLGEMMKPLKFGEAESSDEESDGGCGRHDPQQWAMRRWPRRSPQAEDWELQARFCGR